MKKILYDMFKDASEKLKTAGEEDRILLLDTIASLVESSIIVKNDSFVALDEVVKGVELNYLKMPTELVVDGTDPGMKVNKMNDSSIQQSLREMDNCMLEKCLYGFGQEARGKIVDNLSEKLGYMIMEDTIYFAEGEVKEKEVLDAVGAMDEIIDRLHENSEISY